MKKINLLLISLFLGVITGFSFSVYMHPGSNNRIYMGFVLLVPFSVFFYNVFTSGLSRKLSALSIFFCLIFSVIFLYSLISKANYVITNRPLLKIFFSIIPIILIFASTLYIFMFVENVHWPLSEKKVSKRNIIIYALPSLIIWALYLIGFYPGVMTDDSFSQWNQIATRNFDDWHPFMHTLFNLIITRFWNSPAAIAIAQIIILSVTFGYGLYSLERYGISRKIIYILMILFALNPVNAIMSITLWKDVLYSNFIVLFTILIINIVLTRGEWIHNNINKIFFVFISLGVLFFRHNGIVPFIGTMLLMIYLYKENRIITGKLTLLILVIYVLVRGPVYNLVGVKPGSTNEAFAIPTQQIAAVVANNGYLTEKQKQEINRIMPLNYWAESYVPCNVDYVKFNKNFNASVITQNKAGFLKLWANVCLQNPKIAVKAYLDQTAIIWSIKEQWPTNGGTRAITDNKFGIKQIVINPNIKYIANKLLDITLFKDIKFMFWRPALPLYILIFIGVVCSMKNGKRALLMISPIVFNNLSLAIAIPAQDFRYLYSNSLVFCILFAALFVKLKDKNNRGNSLE